MNEHPEFSFNDDAHSGDEPEYEWLDEWLCEYVDGSMDPALETVFEEYVEANPELKEHVENLRETRHLLGQCSRLKEASRKAKARVCGQVECEMLRSQASLHDALSERTSLVVGVASSMVVALLVGFFAGAVFFSPEGAHVSLSPTAPSAATASTPSATVPTTSITPSGDASSAGPIPVRADRPARSSLALQPLVQPRSLTSPAAPRSPADSISIPPPLSSTLPVTHAP